MPKDPMELFEENHVLLLGVRTPEQEPHRSWRKGAAWCFLQAVSPALWTGIGDMGQHSPHPPQSSAERWRRVFDPLKESYQKKQRPFIYIVILI